MSSCAFHYSEYRCTRPELIDQMIARYPLALISSEHQGQRHNNHIPLFRTADRTLFGHVDRRNPQFQGRGRFPAHLVFMGPQSYIPPEAYRSRLLPTWNYVAVHMDVEIEVLDDLESARAALRDTCERLQPPQASFQYDAADPRVIANAPHILGLCIHVLREEGRFKLSQDKKPEDQQAALDHLLRRDEAGERALLDALLRFAETAEPAHA
ncbi:MULTISPECIES: FMN-binding negative transcriptional regulator [Chromobacterium]|uniref:FMN-binding negative transcriptional regulator n=1 Tax=Chromobacterium aquaticum TaxID=467180 RepID=A0ABV8ZQ97_9NEIS|nr:FMN-binding negative transcriptional regulator [Chromobacterium sp. LK1]MCD5363434.1 FMN-binding negative transcriptional regulator [Chromobacterium aquaticum]